LLGVSHVKREGNTSSYPTKAEGAVLKNVGDIVSIHYS